MVRVLNAHQHTGTLTQDHTRGKGTSSLPEGKTELSRQIFVFHHFTGRIFPWLGGGGRDVRKGKEKLSKRRRSLKPIEDTITDHVGLFYGRGGGIYRRRSGCCWHKISISRSFILHYSALGAAAAASRGVCARSLLHLFFGSFSSTTTLLPRGKHNYRNHEKC